MRGSCAVSSSSSYHDRSVCVWSGGGSSRWAHAESVRCASRHVINTLACVRITTKLQVVRVVQRARARVHIVQLQFINCSGHVNIELTVQTGKDSYNEHRKRSIYSYSSKLHVRVARSALSRHLNTLLPRGALTATEFRSMSLVCMCYGDRVVLNYTRDCAVAKSVLRIINDVVNVIFNDAFDTRRR